MRFAPLLAPIVVLIALSCAVAQETPQRPARDPSKPPPGITVERLYHGLNRPVMINVVSPRSFGTVTLQLMDFDGLPLADAIQVYPGRVDLNDRLPAIWKIRKAAYLQMIDINEPVGSALVLQPMLSRMVPKTEVRIHPVTGNPSTRIVGWIDENDPSVQMPPPPPASTPPPATRPAAVPETQSQLADRPPLNPEDATRRAEQAAAAAAAAEAAAAAAEAQRQAEEARANPQPRERLFSGLRIWSERDVILHTSKGDITICLKPDEAPNTAWNFLDLARGGFYRGIVFHRIVPLTANGQPFVIQAGDPTASGDGGPGYWLPMEDSKLAHDFGVISMARSDDPDSNGSQFFICLSREGTARLDGQYCAFGYAVDGAPVIKAIAEVELADVKAGRPKDPPVIEDAEAVPAPPRSIGEGRPDARVTPEQSRQPTTRPTGRVPR